MPSERPWASQPSARSPRRPWQNGALVPSLQVAISGPLSAPAGAAANGNGRDSVRTRARAGARASTVARALNQRVITDTIGHPVDFMPHIMALSRRRDTDFLGKAGGPLLPLRVSQRTRQFDSLTCLERIGVMYCCA